MSPKVMEGTEKQGSGMEGRERAWFKMGLTQRVQHRTEDVGENGTSTVSLDLQ